MATIERLLVREDFGNYVFGQRITDPAVMKEVLLTHPDHVVRERLVVEDDPRAKASEDPAAGTVEPLPPVEQERHDTLRIAGAAQREAQAEAAPRAKSKK